MCVAGCCCGIHRPQDADTGVAGATEKALLAYVAANPAAFQQLLSGTTPAAATLSELCSGSNSSATQRMRAFSLLVRAAASSSSHAEQLKHAGGWGVLSCLVLSGLLCVLTVGWRP